MNSIYKIYCLLLSFLVVFVSSSHAQPYWNQFRGPNSQGKLEDAKPPFSINHTNALWTCELPSGHSSPVVWGDKIFLTSYDGKETLETICVNRISGNIEWRNKVPADRIEKFHSTSSPATSSPVADQNHVYVYFGSYGILCYDHAGNEKWKRPLPIPKAPIDQGSGISPALYDNKIYFVYGSMDKSSYLECIDTQTGDTIWKEPRPFAIITYSTPVVWNVDNQTYLVVPSNGKLSFYDPQSGEEKWWITGLASSVISVPVFSDRMIYCSTKKMGGFDNSYETDWSWTVILEQDKNNNGSIEFDEMKDGFLYPQRRYLPKDNPGFGHKRSADHMMRHFDLNKDNSLSKEEWYKHAETMTTNYQANIIAVKPGNEGDCTATHIVWKHRRFVPEVPSILQHNNRIYIIRDGGIFVCLDAETGDTIYTERVNARGQYMASPIIADGKIYVCSVNGVVTVIKAGDEFEILTDHDFEDEIHATPAIHNNEIYIRTTNQMYAFGK